MTAEARNAATELVRSLREAVEIHDAQQAWNEDLRSGTSTIENTVQQALEVLQRKADPAAVETARQEWRQVRPDRTPQECLEESREASRLGRRREVALCDAIDALMLLHTDAETRPAASRIAAILRELRLLQVIPTAQAFLHDDLPYPPPPNIIPPSPPIPKDPEAQRSALAKHMAALDAHMQQYRDRTAAQHEQYDRLIDERTRRTGDLLRHALDQAETLTASLHSPRAPEHPNT